MFYYTFLVFLIFNIHYIVVSKLLPTIVIHAPLSSNEFKPIEKKFFSCNLKLHTLSFPMPFTRDLNLKFGEWYGNRKYRCPLTYDREGDTEHNTVSCGLHRTAQCGDQGVVHNSAGDQLLPWQRATYLAPLYQMVGVS